MKKILLLTLSAGFLLSACQKSETPSKQEESCKVKTIEFSGEKLYYTYDAKGRVTRIDHNAEQSKDYESITYQSDKIIVSEPNQESITYTLDASGKVVSGGGYAFKYNADGYLIEAKETGTTTFTTSFSYQNGNLVKVDYLRQYSSGSEASSTVIEYNNESIQNIAGYENILGNFSFTRNGALASYFGKASKNLVSKDTFKMAGYPDEITNYTYQKDDKGKVTSIKRAMGNDQAEMKITYQCQ